MSVLVDEECLTLILIINVCHDNRIVDHIADLFYHAISGCMTAQVLLHGSESYHNHFA